MDEKILQIVLQARDEASAKLKSFSNSLGDVQKGAGLVTGAVVAAGAAIAGAGLYSIHAASDFNDSLKDIQGNTGMTNAQVEIMRQTVLKFASDSGVPLNDLSNGFMHIMNEGYNASDSVTVLNAAMEASVVTGANASDVSNSLAVIMHNFGAKANEASTYMAKLIQIAAHGNLTLQDLAGSFQLVASMGSNIGLSLDQVGAAYDLITRSTGDAARAQFEMQGLMTELTVPASTAKDEFAKLGAQGRILASDFTPAGLQAKGFAGVLDDVKKATDGNVVALKALFPDARAFEAALTFLSSGGKDYANVLKQIQNANGETLNKEYTDRLKEFSTQWNILKKDVQELAINIGNKLLPVVTQVTTLITNNLVPSVTNLSVWIQKNSVIIGIAAGIVTSIVLPALMAYEIQMGIKNVAAVAGFIAKNDLLILSFAKQTVQVIAAIVQMTLFRNSSLAMTVVTQGSTVAVWAMNAALYANPIGLVIIAIAALTAGIILAYTHITVFRNFVNAAWNEVVNLWNHLDKLQVVLTVIAGPLGIIISLAATLASHFNDVANAVNNALSAMGKLGGSIGNSGVGKTVGNIAGMMGFADGGYVPQTGLAVVHQGEFVMSKSMLSGQRGVPSQVSSTINNNQPVVIYATVNSDIDMNLLGNKIAFAMRNSR